MEGQLGQPGTGRETLGASSDNWRLWELWYGIHNSQPLMTRAGDHLACRQAPRHLFMFETFFLVYYLTLNLLQW